MSGASPTQPIRLGARTSALARAQANEVATALAAGGTEVSFVGITTTGDLDQRQLTEIGGTGVFVSAVRDALRRDEIDLAVHSLKDLPTTAAEDLEIIAIPVREDTRDVLVGRQLDDLGDGAGPPAGASTDSRECRDTNRAGTRGKSRCGDLGRCWVAPARPTAGDRYGPKRDRRQTTPSTDS